MQEALRRHETPVALGARAAHVHFEADAGVTLRIEHVQVGASVIDEALPIGA